MFTALLGRLFGIGRVPESMRNKLEDEGVILLEEGLPGSIGFRNFRGPGQFKLWAKKGMIGWLVLTKKQLCMYGNVGVLNINIPREQFAKVTATVENLSHLQIKIEIGDFEPNYSGEITLRFKTPTAQQWVNALRT